MTTNLISIEFGPRPGHVAVSAYAGTSAAPRVRQAIPMAGTALVADWQKPIHKSTGVSVPGCRGVT